MTTITTWLNRGTAPAADAVADGSSASVAVSHAVVASAAATPPIVLLIMFVLRWGCIRLGRDDRHRASLPAGGTADARNRLKRGRGSAAVTPSRRLGRR